MGKKKLDDAFVRTVPSPTSGAVVYTDTILQRFVLIVRKRGGDIPSKRFAIRYSFNGERKTAAFGEYVPGTGDTGFGVAKARAKARQMLAHLDEGLGDPAFMKTNAAEGEADVDVATILIKDAVEKFLAAENKRRKWRPGTREANTSVLKCHFVAVLGDVRLVAVGQKDVQRCLNMLNDETDPTGGMLWRLHRAIRHFFRWCVNLKEWLRTDPTAKLETPPRPKRRTRVLAEWELAVIWEASLRMSGPPIFPDKKRAVFVPDGQEPYGALVRLMILTGQRISELGNMTRSEIVPQVGAHKNSRTFVLPGPRSKNHREHYVPLTDFTWSVITGLPTFGSERIIPYTAWWRSRAFLDEHIADVCRELGLPMLKRWVYHDLRRTFRSICKTLEFAPRVRPEAEVLEAVLNHTPSRLTRTYDPDDDPSHHFIEKQEALQLWSDYIEKLVKGRAFPKAGITLAEADAVADPVAANDDDPVAAGKAA